MFYQNTYTTVKNLKSAELNTLAEQTADKINRFLFERKADLSLLTAAGQLNTAPSRHGEITAYLQQMLAAYQVYDLIAVVSETGELLYTAGDSASLQNRENPLPTPAGKPFISDFFTTGDGDHGLLISVPLAEGKGAVLGVLKSDTVDAILEDVRFGRSGRAYLSAQNPESLTPQWVTSYGKSRDPLPVFGSAALKPEDTQDYQWRVIVAQDAPEAYEVAYKSIEIYFVFVFMIALVGFFLIAMVLTRRIAHPMSALARRVEGRYSGQPGQTAVPSPLDEYGSLSASFEMLWDEIDHLTHQLLVQSGETVHLEQVRSLGEHMKIDFTNGALAVSGSGRLIYANRTAESLLGVSLSAYLGSSLEAIQLSDLDPFFSAVADLLRDPSSEREGFCTIRHPQEGFRELAFVLHKQWMYHAQNLGTVILLRIQSEENRFQESLLRTRRLSELGELSAGLAHEIRNPLASIKGYAQMALLELEPQHPAAADLHTVLSETDRLEALAGRFLSFAKPDTPRKSLYRFTSLLQEVMHLMAAEASERQVRIRMVDCYDGLFLFDYDQLRQAVINLVQNSIQASPPEREVRISVRQTGEPEGVLIRVDDDGPGVPPKIRDRIFNPFFTTKSYGTGLGLSICSRIAEKHGGTLTVRHSESGGARFDIHLPAYAEKGDSHE